MALSILDGNQSATTLSTILSSGQHITAHTVVSLGTQAITDIVNATSAGLTNTQLRASAVTISGTVTADIVGYNYQESGTALIPVKFDNSDQNYIPIGPSVDPIPLPISGTVTAGGLWLDAGNNVKSNIVGFDGSDVPDWLRGNPTVVPISGTVTIGSALPAGTNRIGVVTIGAGTVTLGASTAQIGSVTASISGTVPVSGTFFQATQPVSLTTLPALSAGTAQIGSVTASISGTVPVSGTFWQATQPASLASLPALAAGTAQIGSVTASISNSVVTFYPLQGTTVSNTNFTSITASTTLVSAVAGREVLTVFNEGAGNLHISAGATCTTISYQVRLSAGDYWECPQGQLSLAHTAVFATAGTARVCQVS